MNDLPTVGGPARWEPPRRFPAVKPQLPQVKVQHKCQETGNCGNLPDTKEKHPPCQARLAPCQALVEPLNHEFNRIIDCVPGGQVRVLPFPRHSPASGLTPIVPHPGPCTQPPTGAYPRGRSTRTSYPAAAGSGSPLHRTPGLPAPLVGRQAPAARIYPPSGTTQCKRAHHEGTASNAGQHPRSAQDGARGWSQLPPSQRVQRSNLAQIPQVTGKPETSDVPQGVKMRLRRNNETAALGLGQNPDETHRKPRGGAQLRGPHARPSAAPGRPPPPPGRSPHPPQGQDHGGRQSQAACLPLTAC